MGTFKSRLIVLLSLVTSVVCCPPEAPLQFGNQWKLCVSEQTCRDKHLVIYGSTCIRTCPYGTFYFTDRRTCYDECPSDTVSEGKRCLNGTFCVSQNNSFLFSGSCRHSCPDSAPFIKYGTCYDRCPVDTVLNDSLCIYKAECISNGGFVYNHTCVEECPEDSKYEFLSMCYSSCPDNSFLGSNETCLSKFDCVSKQQGVVFNNTCLPTCPTEAKFDSAGMCFPKCPTETLAYGNRCLTDLACIEKTMVIHEHQCVKTCPDVAPHLLNQRCYSRCPKYYVLHDGMCIDTTQCINEKMLYKVIFNGSCVDACPPEAPITRNGFCVESCPDGAVISDRQCIDPDICKSRHMVIFNSSCISHCPEETPYTSNSICYSQCPSGYIGSDRVCIHTNDCIKNKRVIFNSSCISSCPNEQPYTLNGYCHAECPQHSIRVSNKSICITPTKCKSQGMYIENTTCVKMCPPLRPYHLHSVCHTECPVNSNIFKETQCVVSSDCKHIQHAVLYNGSCLPSCPSHAPNRKGGICYSQCPSGYLSKDTMCVANYECTSSHSVIFNGKCVKSCPDIAPYLEYDTCYISCPGDKLGFNGSKCVFEYECEEKHMFIVDGKCIQKCPPKTLPFMNTICYSLFDVKMGMLLFASIIIVMTLLLLPCIYNPQKSRQMNAPKLWKLIDEGDKDDVAGVHDKDDSILEEVQPTEHSYSSAPSDDAYGNTDNMMLEGPNCSNPAEIELNSIVVHHNDNSDDEPLLLVGSGEFWGGDDGDDALLFGDGSS